MRSRSPFSTEAARGTAYSQVQAANTASGAPLAAHHATATRNLTIDVDAKDSRAAGAVPLTLAASLPPSVMDDMLQQLKLKKVKATDCYVSVTAAGCTVLQKPGEPLNRTAIVHLRNVLLRELQVCQPAGHRNRFGLEIGASIDNLMALFSLERKHESARQGLDAERALTVADFSHLFVRIQSLRGQPASSVCNALNSYYATRISEFPLDVAQLPSQRDVHHELLRNSIPNGKARKKVIAAVEAQEQNDPHRRSARNIASLHRQRVRDLQSVNLTDNTIYGLMFECGYPAASGTATPMRVVPLNEVDALGALRSLKAGDWLDELTLAGLIASLRNNPALSSAAAECAYSLLQTHTSDTELDHTIGVWQAATAIVLNLPPQVLKRMVFAPRVVELLQQEARMLLGNAHLRAMPKKDRLTVDSRERAGGIALLNRMALEAFKTADGQRLAARLGASLQILEHNAQRLVALLENEAGLPAVHEGKPLIDVLDACVPLPGACVRLALPPSLGYAYVERPLLPLTIEGEFPELDSPPAPAQPTPKVKAATQRPEGVTVHLTSLDGETIHESKRPSPVPTRTNKQPGSRPDQPGMHWHPREHEQLEKSVAKDRKLRHKLVNAGLLNPYAEWNAGVRDALLDELRHDRLRRNYGTEVVIGSRLVSGDPLKALPPKA